MDSEIIDKLDKEMQFSVNILNQYQFELLETFAYVYKEHISKDYPKITLNQALTIFKVGFIQGAKAYAKQHKDETSLTI